MKLPHIKILFRNIIQFTFGPLIIPFVVINLILPLNSFLNGYILSITLIEYTIESLVLVFLFMIGFILRKLFLGKIFYKLGIRTIRFVGIILQII